MARQGASSGTQRARDEAGIMVEEAENRTRKVELDANQQLLAKREELEAEAKERRSELSRVERRLEQREEALERLSEHLERSQQTVRARAENLDCTEAETQQTPAHLRAGWERGAGLTTEEHP